MKKLILFLLIMFPFLKINAQSVLITPGNQTTSNNAPDLILRATGVPEIRGIRSDGTLTSPAPISLSGTNLLRLRGSGYYTNTLFSDQAAIDMLSNEAWTSTARGTSIRFFTTQNGTNGMTERMRLADNGRLGIGTTDPQKKVHISSGISGVTPSSTANLLLEDNVSHYIQMSSPEVEETGLLFGKPSNSASGGIIYSAENDLFFRTGGNNNRMRINSNGNVGIGSTTPDFPLHVTSTANTSNSTTGALAIGSTTASHLTFDNNQMDAWNNTSGSTLFLNYHSSGKVQIGDTPFFLGGTESDLEVNGFTKLGGSAPNIKMKKITGTTDADASTNFAHGLTKSKILSVSIFINSTTDNTTGNFYPDHINSAGSTEYRYFVSPTDIFLSDVGTLLQGKPYRVLITYEE